MLGNVLKKVALVLLVVVIYQNWGKIERVFNPSQMVSEQTRAQARVVLYATDWCGYCKQTKRFLDSKGIPFREFDIEKDAEARKAYEALGGRGIPLIDVNGTLIRGFDPDEILAALQ
ncbi:MULTISPECIES: glutaredoxin family protein [Pseudomonas]|uniref:Glutaredoxin family protein n=1 Tax=Pseudomonas moraviensis TaxID=321662 RepID=A0A2A2PIS2_9PSED|nr:MULTISPECIES: glutaredoxin family protein [Pseudomonas]MBA5982161.1 glutaredoxin family protein [Pseudomonas sp. MD195_PC81_125]MBI6946446.1 glutaredoxin family protein [Pseudomonas koreensis]MCU7214116.1 glutaredoxin family protein [Pseudomonas sp. VE 196-7]PAW50840.1 glutaredoxin family protein [Pseudomonas moraviensis]PAW55347.1 glutaredoxin family protein [Pseudomonas moraviensis]